MNYQVGLSHHARTEKLHALAWQSGVFGTAAVWGYFSYAPARLHLFGLSGWGAAALWAALGLLNAVVTLNRSYAVAFVDDEGMELRSFFTHRHIRWIHVSDITVEQRRFDHLLVLRIYRTIGYPVDVPGALAPNDGGVAHTDLLDKAHALRQHWHHTQKPTHKPGNP